VLVRRLLRPRGCLGKGEGCTHADSKLHILYHEKFYDDVQDPARVNSELEEKVRYQDWMHMGLTIRCS